jgi:hypothetical protein
MKKLLQINNQTKELQEPKLITAKKVMHPEIEDLNQLKRK